MANKTKFRPAANKRRREKFGFKHPNLQKNLKGTPSRTAWAKEKRTAHPYVVKKRSPEATAEKLRLKEIKRERYMKRAQGLKKLEQK